VLFEEFYITCSPSMPKILGSEGPQMSISRTPTLKARAAKQRESIEVTVDLPKVKGSWV